MNRNQLAYSATDIHRLSAIDAALGTKDRYTQGHARRVAMYAMRLARRKGLPPEDVGHIGIGGMLHDVGKMGITEDILFKPGPLSPEEYEIVKTHSALGAKIISPVHSLRNLIPIIRHHHERFDGNGYPDGLSGQDIPLGPASCASPTR